MPLPAPTATHRKLFITDFDGTLTDVDFYETILQALPAGRQPPYWEEFLAGRISLFEMLRQVFLLGPKSLPEMLKLVEETGFDSQAGETCRALQAAGWQVVVVSAGCRWYIDLLLERHGIDAEVIANPGRFVEGEGLVMELPAEAEFRHERRGIDKAAVVQAALATFDDVAFAGDGRPDLEAIRLVRDGRRFAKSWLAETLAAEGVAFESFGRWSDIGPRLVNESS